MKKWMGFLVAAALLASQSMMVSAAELPAQEDAAVSVSLAEDGTLTVSGSGAMDENRHLCLWENEGFWEEDSCRSQVTSVVVENGVTDIMHLCGMENLTEVTLPNTLVSIVGAFVDCPNLKHVTIPETVMEIGFAFENLSDDFVASVYAGSYAETYMQEHNIPYEVISDEFTATVGDVNLDGAVDLTDAVMLGKITSGSVEMNDQQKVNADCTKDGSVTTDDTQLLMQFLMHNVEAL